MKYFGDLVKQVRTAPERPADGVVGCVYESFVLGEDCRGSGLRAKIKLRSTLPLCEMHRAAKLERTSLISDGFQRHPQTLSSPPPQGQVFAGTKDSPGVPAPSTGLRPLNVSRVKCGDGPCRGHSALPYAGNTVCLPCAFLKNCGRFDTGLPETRSGATGPSPFKVRDNQRPERSMSGAAKTSA